MRRFQFYTAITLSETAWVLKFRAQRQPAGVIVSRQHATSSVARRLPHSLVLRACVCRAKMHELLSPDHVHRPSAPGQQRDKPRRSGWPRYCATKVDCSEREKSRPAPRVRIRFKNNHASRALVGHARDVPPSIGRIAAVYTEGVAVRAGGC